MNEKKKPLVSIGLPVFNGEDFLEEALRSIVSQTYEHIEIIICDNASTDRTPSIINDFMTKDDRIKYHRHEKNLGAAHNYNSTFNLSCGKYFKWAAHDDVVHESYIEQCVEAMEADDSITLVQSLSERIDEKGNPSGHEYIGQKDMIPENISSCEQYRILMQDRGSWTRIFGLIRSSVLKNTPLIDTYIGSDLTLLGELGLHGNVRDLGSVMFWRREHGNTSTRGQFKERRNRLVWFDSSKKKKKFTLPEWRLTAEIFRSITRQDIPLSSKIHCYRVIIVRMWMKKRNLIKDIIGVSVDFMNIFHLGKQPDSR